MHTDRHRKKYMEGHTRQNVKIGEMNAFIFIILLKCIFNEHG